MIEFEGRRETALEQEVANLATRIEALGELAKVSGWKHVIEVSSRSWAYNPGSWILEGGPSLAMPYIAFYPLLHVELFDLGLKTADFRLTIPRVSKLDVRGSMYGDFFINKAGGILKTLSVPPEQLRDEDIVLDFPQFNGWKIIVDEDAFNRENAGGNLEAVGYVVDSFTKKLLDYAVLHQI